MATENEQVVETEVASDDAKTQEAKVVEPAETEVDVPRTEAEVQRLHDELEKTKAVLEKARKGEKYQKNKVDAEVKKVLDQLAAEKARADSLEQKVRDIAADGVLRQVLKENGAKAVDTALKLVDRKAIKFGEDSVVDVESVKAVITALKASDSILFDVEPIKPATETTAQKPAAPPVVRATDADKVSGYQAELKAAVAAGSSEQLQAVLKKYGK